MRKTGLITWIDHLIDHTRSSSVEQAHFELGQDSRRDAGERS